jgi:hypothetical protein
MGLSRYVAAGASGRGRAEALLGHIGRLFVALGNVAEHLPLVLGCLRLVLNVASGLGELEG